ncbi:MAG: tRNA epoxyqueuosine(34) reductase QueG [Pseudomonadota bacterium]|nr:tRNA epoxyqueuosine(34) reductase QueG [Pseudomonadota bacterium]
MNQKHFFKEIKAKSAELGFEEFGVTDLENFEFNSSKIKEFIKNNHHGEMQWLKDKIEIRSDPKNIWNDAKSAIVLGINYGPESNPLNDLKKIKRGYISIYSRRKDYHKVIKSKLKALARHMQKIKPSKLKVFVDTAPLMEKPLASAAGIGWQGKHTNLVSRNYGSWLFLGVILTNIYFRKKKEIKSNCGTCSKCIDVCPTKAIIKPYSLDARRCISYLTIEHKTHIKRDFRVKIGNRIFGCDDCLAVCPWNKFAKKYSDIKLSYIKKLDMPNLKFFLSFSENDYLVYFAGTPIRRLGYNRFMRNVLIAAANSRDLKLVDKVLKKLDSSNELIRAMAIWALFCLNKSRFLSEKKKRLDTEKFYDVKQEWLNGEYN